MMNEKKTISPELINGLNLLLQGKIEGFNIIYQETYSYVWQRARVLMKNDEDAMELLQEVYIALYKNIDSLEDANSLFGWLKTVTYNQGMKLYRKKKEVLLDEESQDLFDIQETFDASALPGEELELEEMVHIMKSIIEELPEPQKVAVLAYYYDEMSVTDIANMLDVATGTVKSRLNYARKYIKESLEAKEKEMGIRLHSSSVGAFVVTLHHIIAGTATDGMNFIKSYDTLASALEAITAGRGVVTNTATMVGETVASAEVAAVSGAAVAGETIVASGVSAVAKSALLKTVAVLGIAAVTVVGADKIKDVYQESRQEYASTTEFSTEEVTESDVVQATQEETTELDDEEITSTETSTQDENADEEVKVLSQTDYESIVEELKQTNAVQVSEKDMLLSMAEVLVFSRLVIREEALVLPEMTNEEKLSFNYTLLNSGNWVEARDVGQYDAHEAEAVFNDIYLAGELPENDENMTWIQRTDEDTITVQFVEGALGATTTGGHIRENENYYLVTAPYVMHHLGTMSGDVLGYVDVLFVKNADSRFGFSMVYGNTYEEEKKIKEITASSELDSANGKTYHASNLVDGNLDTAWVEGESGLGVGTTITVRLDKATEIYGIALYNGYLASTDLYDKNGKVTEVTVDFGGGNVVTASIPAEEFLYETDEIDELMAPSGRVELDIPIVTDTITITITDAVAGYKYDDVCISEIKVY